MKEAVVLLPFGSYGKRYRGVNLPRLTWEVIEFKPRSGCLLPL